MISLLSDAIADAEVRPTSAAAQAHGRVRDPENPPADGRKHLSWAVEGSRCLIFYIATRSKKLLVVPGHTTRSKDATRSKGHRF